MPEAITLKHHQAVRRVINALRGGRPLRRFITREAELNLRRLAQFKPDQTRAILKNLLFIRQMETAPKGLSVPDGLGAHMNREILKRAATDLNFLLGLINEKGVVDFRKAGLKRKPGYIDLTPKIMKPSLSEQIMKLGRAGGAIRQADLKGDRELGDLMIYETLLNASLELFRIGETKSWAQRAENQELVEQQKQVLLNFARKLEVLTEVFPFGEKTPAGFTPWGPGYRGMIKEKIEIAVGMVRIMNNTAANSTLTGLIRKMSEILEGQEKVRAERQRSSIERSQPDRKIRVTDDKYGKFEVTRTFYELDENGVMRRVLKDVPYGSARDLLQGFEHEKASIEAERDRISRLIDELTRIAPDPLANYPELFELSLGRTGEEKDLTRDHYPTLRDLKKRKALLTLWGAEQLTGIPNDQARALASSLIRVASEDYRLRLAVLEAELQAVPRQKAYAEELAGKLVGDMVKRWTEFFLKYNQLDLKHIRLVERRLGKYFNTFFKVDKEKINPRWFGQERSALVGVLAIFRPFKKMLSDKDEKKLRDNGFNQATLKAAQAMLMLEFNFQNRDRQMNAKDRRAALKAFYAEKAKIYGARIVPVNLR